MGAHLAQRMTGPLIRTAIAIFCVLTAWRMAFGKMRTPSETHVPRSPWLSLAGLGIGTISSIIGIGGGSLTVPLLVALGVKPVRAVATSAACGLVIGLASAASYMAALHPPAQPLPPGALGYFYLPAAAATAVASMTTAQFGVRLAHRLPGLMLNRIFSVFLVAVGALVLFGG